jgi:hypothetical protein
VTAPLDPPEGRFALALNADEPTLTWDPEWTFLDQDYPSLVTSYSIDRGRQYELDRTDGGRATVQIADRDGILDPTNTTGPYYGLIEPLLQAALCRWNPVTEEWDWRFRGFVEEMDYSFDPSQRVNRLTLTLVDIFEILGAVEMQPGQFGVDPVAALVPQSAGQVFFVEEHADDRIIGVLTSCGIPVDFYVVFSLNVVVHQWPYSPGEAAMTPIQEAADSEFPGVSNVFPDRFGRLAVHGRLSKFDPVGVASGADVGQWDFHEWQAGDGAAVAGNPAQFAHIRVFSFNRGLSKIINSALATPVGIADADVAGQLSQDPTSIGLRGIRSWSAQNLLTKEGLLDSTDDLTETKRFANYYTANYAAARNRVTSVGFRSMRPGQAGASENWRLLSKIDIGDTIEITVASPGGGGFNAEPYFVEGIHETSLPANPDYDDVTVTLDVSPRAYFTDNPFPVEP